MARTRTTIRRIDPWSILKFGFVANLVLLGIQLLAGAVVWYVIQRLQLIQTVCELAGTVGFEECGVDGGALFDTFLVLGLLGVVIQTGIMVFLTFLANLIFDLTGGITLTLDDDTGPARPKGRDRSGIGSRATGASALRGGSSDGTARSRESSTDSSSTGSSGRGSVASPPTDPIGTGSTTSAGTSTPGSSSTGRSGDDDTLFGSNR